MAGGILTLRRFGVGDWIRWGILSWLFAGAVEYLLLDPGLRGLDGLAGIGEVSPGRMGAVFAGVFGLLWWLDRRFPHGKITRRCLPPVFLLLAAPAVGASFTWAFLGACVLLLGITAVFARRGWNGDPLPGESPGTHRAWGWVTAGFTVLFFCFVSLWTVARVRSFSTPTYDFGIFSQMFYNMNTTGVPATTLERDGYLSHFAVHVSPIFYLLLPFYALVPRPETLQVLQAAVMASAVIPLWKIGKLHGLPGWGRWALCAALLLYPAFSGGAGYDIHENCFLTPLLLWLLYGIDRKNTAITASAALLTLTVKEDAAVYVAVVGLFAAVQGALCREKWQLRAGAMLAVGAVGWFLGVTAYLDRRGDGVMTGRYGNFMYDGSGSLLAVVRAVVLCPMKAVYECMDPEKLRYIALTMGPLLMLPLMTRRFQRYILLIPYLLVNLMSDYPYQHDLFFQYSFGSLACLFYLTAVNLAELRSHWRRWTALTAVLGICAGCFGAVVVPKAMNYVNYAVENEDRFLQIRQILSRIPENASVAASTFYTVPLSQRQEIYDVGYASREHLLSAEYVVLSLGEADLEKFTHLLETSGYRIEAELPEVLVIYRKTG